VTSTRPYVLSPGTKISPARKDENEKGPWRLALKLGPWEPSTYPRLFLFAPAQPRLILTFTPAPLLHPSAASSLLVAPAPLLPLLTPGRSPLSRSRRAGVALLVRRPSPKRGPLSAWPLPGMALWEPPLPSTALKAHGPSRAWWICCPFSARRPDLQLQAQPRQGSCSSECSLLPVAEVSPLPMTSTHNKLGMHVPSLPFCANLSTNPNLSYLVVYSEQI
jgi:hypothetical protein